MVNGWRATFGMHVNTTDGMMMKKEKKRKGMDMENQVDIYLLLETTILGGRHGGKHESREAGTV